MIPVRGDAVRDGIVRPPPPGGSAGQRPRLRCGSRVSPPMKAEPGRLSIRRAPRFWPCPPGDGSLIRLLCRPSARTLTGMHSWQSPSYVLEPSGTFTPDPGGCSHCADDPGYQHRHWARKAPAAAERQDGPVWRFWYWVFSDWGMGRRAGQAPAPCPADGTGRQG